MVLSQIFQLAVDLEVALYLDFSAFAGFVTMLEPNLIPWDHMYKARYDGRHANVIRFPYNDGVLSVSKHILAARPLVKNNLTAYKSLFELSNKYRAENMDKRHADSCVFPALFRRSTTAVATMTSQSSAWYTQKPYIARHIRTPAGERKEHFNPSVNRYVHTESPEHLCQTYNAASASLDNSTEHHVYLSTNMDRIKRACARLLGDRLHFVDFNVPDELTHTGNPITNGSSISGVAALSDWLFMMDASGLVYSGSSFSSSVVGTRQLKCQVHDIATKMVSHAEIRVCKPP